MRRFFRWLRRNFRSRDPREERAEFELHENWFEWFQQDLESWSRRGGGR